MTNLKHTPGPLEIEPVTVDGKISWYNIHKKNKPWHWVAEIKAHMDIQGEEAHCNARLMAAAPEMLEALINLVKFCEHDFVENYEYKIKDIIEKATGLPIEEAIS